MSSNEDGLNLPWKIYFFNEDGKYDKRDVLTANTIQEMQSPMIVNKMRYFNDTKLEIRVCDSLDYCIMHWKDGKRIFPK